MQVIYDSLETNISLVSPKSGRKVAEIDILAVKDGAIDVYEVKCSYRIHKAKKQLQRIKRMYPQVNNLFFFCGESGVLHTVEG